MDIIKALDTAEEREQAVFSIPAIKKISKDFGREVVLDLSTQEHEFLNRCFPLNMVFSSDEWFTGWMKHWNYTPAEIELFNGFRSQFIDTFKSYSVPVIQLRRTASKEAVCRVFEKVNTGGVQLTAFELLTATYAADDFLRREDWYGNPKRSPGRKGPGNPNG